MTAHFSILAWKIPWTEEPGGLQSMGSQRVRHDLVTGIYFRVYFVWDEYCYSWFLVFSICIKYLFPFPNFQSVFLILEWVSCKQHIGGACCFVNHFFPCGLMILINSMLVLFPLSFLCIYCRFLICGDHAVHIC